MDKKYPSLFLGTELIDLPNYLTEILIKNFAEWQRKSLPKSPFWREKISSQDVWLKSLTKKYVAELCEVNNLLWCFDGDIIAQYFIEKRCIGVKLVKKETRDRIISDLYSLQIVKKKKNSYAQLDEVIKRKNLSEKLQSEAIKIAASTPQKTMINI